MKSTENSPRFVKTRGELSQILGVSTQTLFDWCSRGAPGKGPKGWDVEATRQWRQEHLRQSHEKTDILKDESTQQRFLKAQMHEKEAKAELAKLKLQIERRDFVAKTEIQEWDLARNAVVRRGLLAFVRSLPPLLVGLDQRQMEPVIKRRVNELLERFAKM